MTFCVKKITDHFSPGKNDTTKPPQNNFNKENVALAADIFISAWADCNVLSLQKHSTWHFETKSFPAHTQQLYLKPHPHENHYAPIRPIFLAASFPRARDVNGKNHRESIDLSISRIWTYHEIWVNQNTFYFKGSISGVSQTYGNLEQIFALLEWFANVFA